jgi:paraquat-inducible protein B
MKERETPMAAARPAIIGSFVLSGLALGVVAILLFGSLSLFSTTERAVVFFPGSIAGLTVGAPVTFRGAQVGTVRRISVRLDAKDLTARIPVYLDLHPESVSIVNGVLPAGKVGIERMLKAGLKAQLNTSSFVTGQLQVDLDLRPDIEASAMGEDLGVPEIPAIPSQLETLRDQVAGLQLRQLVDTSQRTLASIQRLSDQLNDGIGPIMNNVQKTAEAARDTLRSTTETVRQFQGDATRTLGDIDQLALEGRQQLNARGMEVSRVLEQAGRTAHGVETLSASLNDMVSPRSQTRGDLNAAIRDLAATASSLRDFSHEVERNPSVILTGRTER